MSDGMGFLEIFSADARAKVIHQLPYWQARAESRKRQAFDLGPALVATTSTAPAALRSRYIQLRQSINEIAFKAAEAEDIFRRGVKLAVEQGRIKPAELPSGLGLLPIIAVALVLAVVAALGYGASLELANRTKALQASVEAWERTWTTFYADFEAWAAAERAAGRNPPAPPIPGAPPGGGSVADTVAGAGIGLTTLLVAGGLLYLFMSKGRK